jgi:hypothetical protein
MLWQLQLMRMYAAQDLILSAIALVWAAAFIALYLAITMNVNGRRGFRKRRNAKEENRLETWRNKITLGTRHTLCRMFCI